MLARGLRAVAFACASALGITFILLSAPAQASSPVEPPSITLPNGLKVFVAEQHTSPLVQTTYLVPFRVVRETAGKTGLAHALEHMMFRGTPSLSASGLSGYVAHFGGQYNASTDEDFTRFYFIVPASQLETTLRIEADRMQHLSLAPDQWNIERGAVLNGDRQDPQQPVGAFHVLGSRSCCAIAGLPVTCHGQSRGCSARNGGGSARLLRTLVRTQQRRV